MEPGRPHTHTAPTHSHELWGVGADAKKPPSSCGWATKAWAWPSGQGHKPRCLCFFVCARGPWRG